jgi:hypothetical protein
MMDAMDINKIISEIIPPDDYQYRNGFSNEHLIDKLSNDEKSEVETELITMLQQKPDMLIVETLGYMKSEKSLPVLYELLKKSSEGMAKLILASSTYRINKDKELVEIAIASFKEIEKIKDAYYVYRIIPTFYYLVKFQESKITKLIEEYSKHPEYLISYNAKQVLGMS